MNHDAGDRDANWTLKSVVAKSDTDYGRARGQRRYRRCRDGCCRTIAAQVSRNELNCVRKTVECFLFRIARCLDHRLEALKCLRDAIGRF